MEKYLVEDLVEVRGMPGFYVVTENTQKSKEGSLKLMYTETLNVFKYPISLVESHYRPLK